MKTNTNSGSCNIMQKYQTQGAPSRYCFKSDSRFCLSVAAIALVASLGAPATQAEIVNYPGTALQTIGYLDNALGPTNAGATTNSASLSGNVINMDGDTANYVFGAASDTGDLSNNTINITGGTVTAGVLGAWAHGSGNATGNIVNISGGTLTEGDVITGGMSWFGNATGNSVNISGGTISHSSIYAGFTSSNGDATNNTIRISGSPVFTNTAMILYGGIPWVSGDTRTGNRLELHTKDITVGNIQNFEILHFYLPAASIHNGDTILTLTGEGANISGSTVGVGMEGGGNPLTVGNKVTLIRADLGLVTDASNLSNTTTGMQGISLLYGFALSATATTLDATVTKAGVNPQTKSLLQGRLAALALANQGADLAAGAGLSTAINEAEQNRHLFAVFSGGSNRYKTGSHIDLEGATLLAGATHQRGNQIGKLTVGGFLETSWASYDSYNNFSDMPNIRASGHNNYYGIGLLGQQDFNNHWYLQGSARIGQLKTSYSSTDLHNTQGQSARYSSRRTYGGVHVGAGYVMPIRAGADTLDLYGKLYWSHYGSDRQNVLGDTFYFASLESVRSQLGGRYTHPLSSQNSSLYAGLAWEREYRGIARGTVFSLNMLEPRLRGSSGIVEAGVKINPVGYKGLKLEAGLQGYAGKRRGVMGQAKMQYAF